MPNHYSSSSIYRPPSDYDVHRYDAGKPLIDRPIYSEIAIYGEPPPNFPRPPSSFSNENEYHPNRRPPPPSAPSSPSSPSSSSPPQSSSNDYLGPYKPPHESSFTSFRPKKPDHFSNRNYLDRDRDSQPSYQPSKSSAQSRPYIPYTINKDAWPIYGGSYGGGGGSSHNQQAAYDFWGLPNDHKRNDANFNYFNLGNGQNPDENAVLSYPGSRYDHETGPSAEYDKDKSYYGNLWTRRPGQEGKALFYFILF